MSLLQELLKNDIFLKLFRYIFYLGLLAVIVAQRVDSDLIAKSIYRITFVVWVSSAAVIVIRGLMSFYK